LNFYICGYKLKTKDKIWWFLLFFPHFCCLETFTIISLSNFLFLIWLLDKILLIKKCLMRIQKVTLIWWPYLKAINMRKMSTKKLEIILDLNHPKPPFQNWYTKGYKKIKNWNLYPLVGKVSDLVVKCFSPTKGYKFWFFIYFHRWNEWKNNHCTTFSMLDVPQKKMTLYGEKETKW